MKQKFDLEVEIGSEQRAAELAFQARFEQQTVYNPPPGDDGTDC